MKVTPTKNPNTIKFNTKQGKKTNARMEKWWLANSKKQLGAEILSTATFLRDNQQYRFRQLAVYSRLYGNQSLMDFVGSNLNRTVTSQNLPLDRPTFNLVQSAADTLVSKIGQSRPSPVFLTDNSDYRERNLAKKLNNFIQGEFYQTKSYEKAVIALRDALVTGDGILHIYEDQQKRVQVERVLSTEILIDTNEGIYGEPRQLYRMKLIDRAVLMDMAPEKKAMILEAEQGFPDDSGDSSKSTSDLVIVVEGWHLPSGPGASDGRHTIACSTGVIFDEPYKKDSFPFVFLKYSPRILGFWAQGLAEQLTGTQLEINSILYTISKSMKLVGVPRVFVEDGSKVVKAHLNNDIGAIITYRGTKPEYSVAPCVPQELYAQLQRLIDYGYRQCGVSALDAGAQKPAGLNSGEAIRSYDDISTDRFAALARRYDNLFIDLAYQIIDLAKDIAERDGSYQTVYPNKNGAKEINLPEVSMLKNPFVIQCFSMSSLPRDPAGRLAKVTEMVQAGMITIKEGRRLLDYPDIEQIERLANASEERIFQQLDEIVESEIDEDKEVIQVEDDQKGFRYKGPDPFMDLALAQELVVQYINLYGATNLEESKMEMFRTFYSQVQDLMSAAQPPAPPPGASPTPQAQAAQLPVSPLVPNAVQ
jgi:hypothetical protein